MVNQLESKTLVFQGLLIADCYCNIKEKNMLIYMRCSTQQTINQPGHCVFHSKEEPFTECIRQAQERFLQKSRSNVCYVALAQQKPLGKGEKHQHYHLKVMGKAAVKAQGQCCDAPRHSKSLANISHPFWSKQLQAPSFSNQSHSNSCPAGQDFLSNQASFVFKISLGRNKVQILRMVIYCFLLL